MRSYWWFSFATPEKFLGAGVVPAGCSSSSSEEVQRWEIARVLRALHMRQINPGGSVQVQLMELPAPPPEGLTVLCNDKDRLDALSEEWGKACEATGVPKVTS